MFKKILVLAFFMYDADPENKGGFNETQVAQLKKNLDLMKGDIAKDNLTALETKMKESIDPINESLKTFVKTSETVTQLQKDAIENQKAVNEVLTSFKAMQEKYTANTESRSLQQAMLEALQIKENVEGMAGAQKGRPFTLELKGRIDLSKPGGEIRNDGTELKVGDMTQANILTGAGVTSYNQRQVILPAQRVNARDLVATTQSPTGIYVTYKETTGQGAPARQTEGSAKAQIDFRFSNVSIVLDYIAAYAKISKQLMTNLPYLLGKVPTLLQREFYKVENRLFWDRMFTAFNGNGITPSAADTDDLLQAMDWITQLADTDYTPSFGLLRYTALNRINQSILTKGYYPGAGGITSGPQGNIMINGTPIYPCTFIPSYDKMLVFDEAYVERVEVNGLKIEFFEQDSDNVEKNLITARIECQEDFNPMQPLGILVGDFGNSATS